MTAAWPGRQPRLPETEDTFGCALATDIFGCDTADRQFDDLVVHVSAELTTRSHEEGDGLNIL